MDLERAETFTGIHTTQNPIAAKQVTTTSNDASDGVYQSMDDDGIIDEDLRINWRVFVARIVALFLFLLIIIFCALEEINIKFLALAAVVCVLLVVVFIATYIDLRSYFGSACFRSCCQKRATASPSESDVQRVLRYSGNISTSSSQALSMRNSIPR